MITSLILWYSCQEAKYYQMTNQKREKRREKEREWETDRERGRSGVEGAKRRREGKKKWETEEQTHLGPVIVLYNLMLDFASSISVSVQLAALFVQRVLFHFDSFVRVKIISIVSDLFNKFIIEYRQRKNNPSWSLSPAVFLYCFQLLEISSFQAPLIRMNNTDRDSAFQHPNTTGQNKNMY